MHKWLIFCLFIFPWNGFAQEENAKAMTQAKNTYSQYIHKHGHFGNGGKHKLHYLQWGNPKHPTIVWLHGSMSNSFEIEPFVKEITALKYNLIAVDYYGHGQTPIPRGSFSAYDLLEDLKILLDSLQIETYIVGGFSRGAYLATLFYDKYPEKVSALLLEDGGVSPFLEHFSILSDEGLKTALNTELTTRPAALFEAYDTEEEAYKALEQYGETEANQLFKNFSFIRAVDGKFHIYKDIDILFGMDTYDNLHKLLHADLLTNAFANDLMSISFFDIIYHSTVPTLLLEASGKNDPFPKTDYYLRLSANNSKIAHKVFNQSTHNIHFEEPNKFLQTITTFLNTIKNENKRSPRDRRPMD